MQKSQETIDLRRTGAIVALAGIVQAALAMANAPAGSFHLQFANVNILFGILIAFGNVRALSAVRWLAWLCLMPAALLLLAGFLLQPAGLLMAQLRFIPSALFRETATQLISLAMVLFILRQLGSTPMLEARAALGRKVRDMRIPLGLGAVLAVAVAGLQAAAVHSADAEHAVQLAQAEMGPQYEYFASHIHFEFGANSRVMARVQLWNDRELREIPVQWRKP
ncbi:hypothetical protein [Pseudoduganella sp.]|uniref:hypothetical protein n=1 Tax=Pseudoduganella sp. TaxID=1880898 RepID=UPI0035AFC89D